MSDLIEKDISTEAWREYDFSNRVYKIYDPKKLFYRDGGSTHRVVDKDGEVHCVPAPGYFGCVLRWSTKNKEVPVDF